MHSVLTISTHRLLTAWQSTSVATPEETQSVSLTSPLAAASPAPSQAIAAGGDDSAVKNEQPRNSMTPASRVIIERRRAC